MTAIDKPKRGPGRPKGLGRVPGSGRAKGTRNKDRTATIEQIMREADPIQYLCKVARGDRMEAGDGPDAKKKSWWFPTGDQRLTAMQTLARKVLPDLRATELTGRDGEPVIPPTRVDELYSTMEVARRLAFVLAGGLEAKRVLEETDASGVDPEPEPIPEPEAPSKPVEEPPEPPVEPAEPSLPKHAYLHIEEGVLDPSGTRAWVVMAGREEQSVFHGADARQLARDWMARKFGASPAEEIELPLSEEVIP